MSSTVIKQNTTDLQTILGMIEALPEADDIYPDTYDGACEITPSLEEQVLPTAQKVMPSDITIKQIPITTVSNTSGGNTVIIGG